METLGGGGGESGGECGGGKGRGEEWVRSRRTRIISATSQFPRRRRLRRTVWALPSIPPRDLRRVGDQTHNHLSERYRRFRRRGSNLPHRSSPEDLLDKDFPLILELRDNNLTISDRDPISNGNTDSAVELKRAALAAANRSYAPYSLCPSGVSLVVVKKMIVVGYGKEVGVLESLNF